MCSPTSLSSPSISSSLRKSPAASRPARSPASSTGRRPPAAGTGSRAGRTRLTITAPAGRFARRQLVDGVEGLLHRQVLELGDDVHDGLRGVQQRHDALALRADRAGPRERAHRLRDVEELHDAARGRRVQDHRVVEGLAGATAARPAAVVTDRAPDALLHLPGQQHVPQARRERRRELDGAHASQGPPGEPEVVEHLEVLEQGLLGVDREAADLAAVGGHRDALLRVGQRRGVEELGDALAALDLDEQGAPAAGREGQRERGGQGRLPGAALARHDVEAGAGQGLRPALDAAVAQDADSARPALVAHGDQRRTASAGPSAPPGGLGHIRGPHRVTTRAATSPQV